MNNYHSNSNNEHYIILRVLNITNATLIIFCLCWHAACCFRNNMQAMKRMDISLCTVSTLGGVNKPCPWNIRQAGAFSLEIPQTKGQQRKPNFLFIIPFSVECQTSFETSIQRREHNIKDLSLFPEGNANSEGECKER